MISFNKEELIKLASLSCLKLDSDEVEALVEQIKLVLNYAQKLDAVELSTESLPTRNVNVFREDEAKQFVSESILDQAPKKEDSYFVVPKIL